MNGDVSAGLPAECLVYVPGLPPGRNVGVARRGVDGVCLQRMPAFKEGLARAYVRVMNNARGVTPAQSFAMFVGSMRGWEHPKADPAVVEALARNARPAQIQ
ncbi:MAG TPA: hypothetical protein VFR86_22555 [Burkholderiaceae bacterium]|nr:hypothetical protein [Burkholderiaceae bacterium]